MATGKTKKGLSVERPFDILNVIRIGFEPMTYSLEGCCSIQLSYRTLHFRVANL